MTLVTKDGWTVCYVERVGEPGVELWVFRHHESGAPELTERGKGDKGHFDSRQAASDFAFDHGYLQTYSPDMPELQRGRRQQP